MKSRLRTISILSLIFMPIIIVIIIFIIYSIMESNFIINLIYLFHKVLHDYQHNFRNFNELTYIFNDRIIELNKYNLKYNDTLK